MSEQSDPSRRFFNVVNKIRQAPNKLREMKDVGSIIRDKIYDFKDVSIDHSSGVVPMIRDLCQAHGISVPPKLRSALFFPHGGVALTNKNTILLSDNILTQTPATVKALLAHEMAHIIFKDGKRSNPQNEARADRFALFATNDTSGLIDYLTEQNSLRDACEEAFKKSGGAFGNNPENYKKAYGSFEQRLDNLKRPITEAEKVEFTCAIEAHNAQMAKEIRVNGNASERGRG